MRGTRHPLSIQERMKRAVYFSYRSSANKKRRLFTLSFDEFVHLISLPCYYCGRPPANTFIKKHSPRLADVQFAYQGIDRVDNSCGYTRENSVPCCKTCNNAKGTMTHAEFVVYIIEAFKHLVKTSNYFESKGV